jgi:hypothetical protein
MRHKWFNTITVQIQIILCLLILPFSCLAQYVPNPQVSVPSVNNGTSRQFTDKEHDETNLNYFNSRYYDSKTGRFN